MKTHTQRMVVFALILTILLSLVACRGGEVPRDDSLVQAEWFTISHSQLDSAITQMQIDPSEWQRSSISPHLINATPGVSIVDFTPLPEAFAAFQSRWYSLDFRFRNDTDRSVYYEFPEMGTLEKYINGQWYELPIFRGALRHYARRGWQAVVATLYAEAERWGGIELNFWRPYQEGLYRIILELSFDPELEDRFLLSETFEIRRQDFVTRFQQDQMNAVEEVSLSIVGYDYENNVGTLIIRNDSRHFFVDFLCAWWGLEKYIDGQWYEIPFNDFLPCGNSQGGGNWGAPTVIMRGTESEETFRLMNWYPLDVGIYRLTRMMYKLDPGTMLPLMEGEYHPVSVMFEIAQ